MATSKEYIEFVCEQLHGCGGEIRYRKMFGEYMVYINDKPALLVCDDTVFAPVHDSIAHLMQDAERGVPYDGAKERYILDIEDRELAHEVMNCLDPHLLDPRPKKRKK